MYVYIYVYIYIERERDWLNSSLPGAHAAEEPEHDNSYNSNSENY